MPRFVPFLVYELEAQSYPDTGLCFQAFQSMSVPKDLEGKEVGIH